MKLLSLCSLIILAGCAPPLSPQQRCINLGMKPGTSAFQQCTMNMYQSDQQRQMQIMRMNQAAQAQQNENARAAIQAISNSTSHLQQSTYCYPMGNGMMCN